MSHINSFLRRVANAHCAAIGGVWLVLFFAFGRAVAASNSEDLTMPVGATTTVANVDAGATVSVRVFSGGRPFYVESPSARRLVVVGATRGEGDLMVQRGGVPYVYHITVTSIADPTKPLAPGTNPPPMGSPQFGPLADRVGSSTVAVAQGVTPTTYTVSPSWLPPPPSDAQAGAQVEPNPVGAPVSGPVISGQSVVTPPSAGTFATDPSVPARSLDRGLTIPGRNPLPEGPLTLTAGTGGVYDFPDEIARISISDSKIADVQVVNPHQLMIVGKEPGFSSLFIWDNQNNYFERQVHIEKGGEQQVLLNVIVAEVNRTKAESEGIDITAALTHYGLSFAGLPGMVANAYTATSVFNTPNGTYTGFLPPGGNYYPLPVSNNITYAIGGANSNVSTNSFFQFLEDHSLGKVLAEPNLLATSGEEAKFLSGGEIPIIVSQALNTSIVFKQYGTSISFVPTVVGSDEIELLVRPEVSAPDYTHQVVLNGFSVPSFVTRKAETEVHLRDNQTLVIAGLMQETTTSDLKKVPYLGDLPYAGALFRNTYYSHIKTELVMSVTPRLVLPIPVGGLVNLPTTHAGVMTPSEVRTEALPVDDVTRPRFP